MPRNATKSVPPPTDSGNARSARPVAVNAIAALILIIMAALMLGPARQDSATVDETTFLGAGYSYWKGYRYYIAPDHSPLSQMLAAAPLLAMDVRLSPNAQALLDKRSPYAWAIPWYGPPRAIQELYPQGRNDWYFVATPESQLFGQIFVYDGTNDGDAMMFASRCVQMLLTLCTGVLIFFWVRRAVANDLAALLALALWVFNPHALGCGHLITTDISGALGMTVALFSFARLLEKPTTRNSAVCGLATAFALLMKYTAMILGPIYVVLVLIRWKKMKPLGVGGLKLAAILVGAAWLTVMIVYAPMWSPAPPLSDAQATALGVPEWFRSLRVLLVPPGFFKVIAYKLAQSKWGHEGYLLGEWSNRGWWYYFPLGFVLKSPLAFVVLIVAGFVSFVRRLRAVSVWEMTSWVAAVLFLLSAMTSKVNVGVRHLLPIVPLLCVGVGCGFARLSGRVSKRIALTLLAWQVLVSLLAYPLYIQFFSEAAGGAKNGYKYLLDSNFDWGQDAKRLKKFLEDQGIGHIYLDYFGTQYSIEYLKIPNTRVNAEQARQIKQGYLVVSASQLMRPEWNWLRESRSPVARVAYTLFVYQFP
jgi:hypothetical protein